LYGKLFFYAEPKLNRGKSHDRAQPEKPFIMGMSWISQNFEQPIFTEA